MTRFHAGDIIYNPETNELAIVQNFGTNWLYDRKFVLETKGENLPVFTVKKASEVEEEYVKIGEIL